MKFLNPSAICSVCGKHRMAKGVDHTECSKKRQAMTQTKRTNRSKVYPDSLSNAVDYWEKNEL